MASIWKHLSYIPRFGSQEHILTSLCLNVMVGFENQSISMESKVELSLASICMQAVFAMLNVRQILLQRVTSLLVGKKIQATILREGGWYLLVTTSIFLEQLSFNVLSGNSMFITGFHFLSHPMLSIKNQDWIKWIVAIYQPTSRISILFLTGTNISHSL